MNMLRVKVMKTLGYTKREARYIARNPEIYDLLVQHKGANHEFVRTNMKILGGQRVQTQVNRLDHEISENHKIYNKARTRFVNFLANLASACAKGLVTPLKDIEKLENYDNQTEEASLRLVYLSEFRVKLMEQLPPISEFNEIRGVS